MQLPEFGQLAAGTPIEVSHGYIDYQPTQVVPYGPPTHYGYPEMFPQANLIQHGIATSYAATQPFLTDSTNALRSEAGPSAFQGSYQRRDSAFESESTDEALWMQWLDSLTDVEREQYLREAARQA